MNNSIKSFLKVSSALVIISGLILFNAGLSQAADLIIITDSTLANAKVGNSYTATITGTGGPVNSYVWSLATGSVLPAGLTLGANCSVSSCQQPIGISGTPASAGTYTFSITLSCGTSTVTKVFSLTVDPAVPVNPLTISLDSTTPVAATIGNGATGISLLTARIANSSTNDLSVISITPLLHGTGGAFSNFKLYDDKGTVLASNSSASSSGGVDYNLPLPNFTSLVIPKSSYRTVTLKADLNSLAASGYLQAEIDGGQYMISQTTAGVAVNETGTALGNKMTIGQLIAPNILTIVPGSAPAGTTITVTGFSFTPTDNKIKFGPGATISAGSSDGKTLSFPVPYSNDPPSPGATGTALAAGTYNLSISNANGISNFAAFIVTGPTPQSPSIAEPSVQQNAKPVGWIDSVAGGFLSGWAIDPDHAAQPITVHIYFDAKPGIGSTPVGITTDISRPDVNTVMTATGTHGFKLAIPDNLRDGKQHVAYVYGLDLDDITGAANVQLYGSPKVFTFSADSSLRHPRGTVVMGENGTVYFLGTTVRYPFPNPDVFFSWSHKFSELVLANAGDLALPIGPAAATKTN